MKIFIPNTLVFIIVISSLLLTSCFTKVSTSDSEFRAPPYPPLPDRIFQLAPEKSDRILLGIEKEKNLIDIARRLEWEGFSICSINEETQTLAAEQRFRDEPFTLQVNLIKSGDTLEAVMIWSPPRTFPHPLARGRSNPQRWHKAYRSRSFSSNSSKAFATGAFHILYIPHHSHSFESGYHHADETSDFCRK